MPEPKTRHTIWVEDDLWDAVTAEAERRGESVSAELRRLMRNYTRASRLAALTKDLDDFDKSAV